MEMCIFNRVTSKKMSMRAQSVLRGAGVKEGGGLGRLSGV